MMREGGKDPAPALRTGMRMLTELVRTHPELPGLQSEGIRAVRRALVPTDESLALDEEAVSTAPRFAYHEFLTKAFDEVRKSTLFHQHLPVWVQVFIFLLAASLVFHRTWMAVIRFAWWFSPFGCVVLGLIIEGCCVALYFRWLRVPRWMYAGNFWDKGVREYLPRVMHFPDPIEGRGEDIHACWLTAFGFDLFLGTATESIISFHQFGLVINVLMECLVGKFYAIPLHFASYFVCGEIIHWVFNYWQYIALATTEVTMAVPLSPVWMDDVCCYGQVRRPPRVGAEFNVDPSLADDFPCEARSRLCALAFYVKDAFPVAARRCWHNVVLATANRVIMEVPVAAAGIWDSAEAALVRRTMDLYTDLSSHDPLREGMAWVNESFSSLIDATAVAGLTTRCLEYANATRSLADANRTVEFVRGAWAAVRGTYDDWVARFPAVKQERLADLYSTMHTTKDLIVKPFIKLEKVLKGVDLEVNGSKATGDVLAFDPRVISNRSDVYQATCGPYCVHVSDMLRHAWNIWANTTFACGMNATKIGRWMDRTLEMFPGGHFLMSDFSRFDATVSVPALAAQNRFMSRVAASPSPMAHLDDETFGVWNHRTWYHVSGTRKSGNADTSVGNSILNAMFWAHALETIGVRANQTRLIVLGDDAVLACNTTSIDVERLRVCAEKMGLVFKGADVGTDVLAVKFCGCRFFSLANGTHYPAGLPGVALAKMGWALDMPESRTVQDEWLRALAHTLVLEYSHVPVIRALAVWLNHVVSGLPLTYDALTDYKVVIEGNRFTSDFQRRVRASYAGFRDRVNVTKSMVEEFATFYGLTMDDVDAAETYLLRMEPSLPAHLDHWVISRLVERDVA